MADSVITAEGVSKLYRIGRAERRHETLFGATLDWIKTPYRNLKKLRALNTFRASANGNGNGKAESDDLIWAIRDVSFEVKQGEVLGIIGRNGAGKSTLLKLLSRITEPTSGRIRLRGRVSSLLEVGTGFHPELTGRDNVYLNGTILGMTKREIDRKFDEIVDFSGVERFLDTPVKRYSSGMQVRLAFAVAAHLEPETLIVDEVLAVGDTEFQKKCLGKMGEINRDGRTVLMVSHNMPSIVNFCHRAILIRQGRVVLDGSVEDVVPAYLMSGDAASGGEVVWPDPEQAPGTDLVRLHAVRVYQEDGRPTADVDMAKDVIIEISYWVLRSGHALYTGLWLRDHMGTNILSTQNTRGISLIEDRWAQRPRPAGFYRSRCIIPGHTLNNLSYRVTPILGKDVSTTHLLLEDLLAFAAHDTGATSRDYQGQWIGVIRPRLAWDTELAPTT